MAHKKHKKHNVPKTASLSSTESLPEEKSIPSEEQFSPQNKENFISIILGAFIVIFIGVLVFNYFKNLNKNFNFSKQNITNGQSTGMVGSKDTSGKTADLKNGTYKVKSGEGLWNIAVTIYNDGYKWTEIAKANNLSDPFIITEGQILKIPKLEVKKGDINGAGISTASPEAITGSTYKIVNGDCLWDIAIRACGDGYKWVKLAEDNKLENPDLIYSGNVLKIQCK